MLKKLVLLEILYQISKINLYCNYLNKTYKLNKLINIHHKDYYNNNHKFGKS